MGCRSTHLVLRVLIHLHLDVVGPAQLAHGPQHPPALPADVIAASRRRGRQEEVGNGVVEGREGDGHEGAGEYEVGHADRCLKGGPKVARLTTRSCQGALDQTLNIIDNI